MEPALPCYGFSLPPACPGRTLPAKAPSSGLPGELVEGIAPGLDTRIPLVGFAIAATLVSHGEVPARAWMLLAPAYRPGHHPIPPGAWVPGVSPLWQATEKAIRVQDEKMVDLLVVGLDLLHQEGLAALPAPASTGSWCGW